MKKIELLRKELELLFLACNKNIWDKNTIKTIDKILDISLNKLGNTKKYFKRLEK